LPGEPQELSALLSSDVFPQPHVRLIPLIRNGVAEAGFSAEVTAKAERAFLMYRPQPYEPAGGHAHVGVFVGGRGPRPGEAAKEAQAAAAHEERIVAALARALLLHQPDAPGLVDNRCDKRFMKREEALAALEAILDGAAHQEAAAEDAKKVE
jgi:hypothetical protein